MQDSIFTMPTLPAELIAEILSRLPVKSLLKFRCVSKPWRALISSPDFVKYHLSVSARNKDYTHHRVVLTELRTLCGSIAVQYILRDCSLSSLRSDSVIEAVELHHPMKNPEHSVCVVGSVNGLICLAIKDIELVLWNPSIRLFKNLPDSRPKVTCGYGLNRPTGSVYGFGYDESNDDYKVVGVPCIDSGRIFHHDEVKIYSLKSNSWKNVDDLPDGMQLNKPGKFVNRKLHWAGELNWVINMNGRFQKNWNIISIDLANEKWEKLEQPRYGEGGDFSLELEVLGSDLSVLCNYMSNHADLWVMREYGVKESWTKMYTIKYPGYSNCPFIYTFSPNIYQKTLSMSNKGDILLVPGSTLMVHNPKDEPIRYPKVTNFGFCVAVDIYIESLVCAPLYRTNRAQNKNEGCRS